MEIPWPADPSTLSQVGHRITWINAVFVGDPDAIRGAEGRSFRRLSTSEFNEARSKLRVRITTRRCCRRLYAGWRATMGASARHTVAARGSYRLGSVPSSLGRSGRRSRVCASRDPETAAALGFPGGEG